jgi:hypothetical protein
MENSMQPPQKLKIELPYDPTMQPLGIHPKEYVITIKASSDPYLLQHYSQ